MTSSAEQIRAYKGPAILSYGFRPLFLAACFWSTIVMGMWIAMLAGYLSLPTALDPISWHVHEFLYGYLPAVIAGFLLTAVPNWTGRLPIIGTRLLVLVLTWMIGRVAILFSDPLGVYITAAIDLSFLILLSFVIGREVIAGRNWRNLKVLILGGALAYSGFGARLGVAVAIFLIALIGGRIVPSFTRNWLARTKPGRLPVPFNHFDAVCIIISGTALFLWVVMPENISVAFLFLITGVLNTMRFVRWAGDRTLAEPLVSILHVGYAFVPIGFLLIGLAILLPTMIPVSAAYHAWTAGAIGTMTLAVMTRASLGHLSMPLHATKGIVFIYISVIIAALTRIVSGVGLASGLFLNLSAGAWLCAYISFVFIYGPLLLRPRKTT
jgi:uncharacterized protein involved in response to NO